MDETEFIAYMGRHPKHRRTGIWKRVGGVIFSLTATIAWADLDTARSRWQAGDIGRAKKEAKQYLAKNPKSAEGWTVLGEIYVAMNANGKALRRFNKALKNDSHYAPAYVGRGRVYELRGKLDEAVNEYRAASLCDPKYPEAAEGLARLTTHAMGKE